MLAKLMLALLDDNTKLQREKDVMESAALAMRDDMRLACEQLGGAEKRIADQNGIIASARKFISEYAGLGDIGAAEFIKIIDRAAARKGE